VGNSSRQGRRLNVGGFHYNQIYQNERKTRKMKLDEFKALVIEQRKAQQAQNLEAILSVASATIPTTTERKEN
jgi:hypothetical protein